MSVICLVTSCSNLLAFCAFQFNFLCLVCPDLSSLCSQLFVFPRGRQIDPNIVSIVTNGGIGMGPILAW